MALKMPAGEDEPPDQGFYPTKLVDLRKDEGQIGSFVTWLFTFLEKVCEGHLRSGTKRGGG